jgi:hypothetical protein
MLFCLVTRYELFPFAPYTMYSNLYLPEYQRILDVSFVDESGETIALTDQMIAPFDEARFKHALLTVYFNTPFEHQTLKHPLIKSRSIEALKKTYSNIGIKFKTIELSLSTYKTLDDLRHDRKTNIEKVSFDDE